MMGREKTMDKGTGRRYAVTCIAVVLLLILYYMIFHFSAQDGDASSSISQRITQKGVEIANTLSGNKWSEEKMVSLRESWEHLVRKSAHFAEYAYMGVLVYVLWSQWLRRGKKLYLLTVGWVFLSAAGDEFHQYFVPGRYASPLDVLLDTCGGAFGMLACICVMGLCKGVRDIILKKSRKNVSRKG